MVLTHIRWCVSVFYAPWVVYRRLADRVAPNKAGISHRPSANKLWDRIRDNAMNMKELYQEYLKTPRWKELRKQALINACNKCQVCNSTKRLNVHHRQYPEVWGEEPQSFLTVLCNKCHKLFHQKPKAKQAKAKRGRRRRKKKPYTYKTFAEQIKVIRREHPTWK